MPESKINSGKQVVILGCPGHILNIIYNSIAEEIPVYRVIVEKQKSRQQVVWQKIRCFGVIPTMGQILFLLFSQNILEPLSKKRRQSNIQLSGMDTTCIPNDKVIKVKSVNSKVTRSILHEENPDIVIVYGTRIIDRKTLDCTSAAFINIHPGLTPGFRGLCTGYWAMLTNPSSVGVTIHNIDEGVDSGSILKQTKISPTRHDNISTIKLRQIEAGLPLLKQVALDCLANKAVPTPHTDSIESKQWTHPTLWAYCWNFLRFGVK